MATLRLLALPLLAALALPAAAGDLKGVVHYAGTPPKNPPYAATRDQKVCGQGVPNESVEVANGHLGNVVITLKGSGLPKPPPQTITIDQRQCRYRPHVQAAGAGSTLQILNSDPMLHNIHGYMGQQTLFNLAMPIQGQRSLGPCRASGSSRSSATSTAGCRASWS